jgi:uncharacterized membrane protein AbrB (regulator of aidB expression)
MKSYTRWVSAAATIVALGILFTYLDLPAGWLIAGMLGAARRADVPARAHPAREGHVRGPGHHRRRGRRAADQADGLRPAHFAGCAAFSVGVTLTLSVVLGLALARLAKDLGTATANLSLIAGGASTISSMARELGADERYVALSQYLRLTIVVLTMPMVLGAL